MTERQELLRACLQPVLEKYGSMDKNAGPDDSIQFVSKMIKWFRPASRNAPTKKIKVLPRSDTPTGTSEGTPNGRDSTPYVNPKATSGGGTGSPAGGSASKYDKEIQDINNKWGFNGPVEDYLKPRTIVSPVTQPVAGPRVTPIISADDIVRDQVLWNKGRAGFVAGNNTDVPPSFLQMIRNQLKEFADNSDDVVKNVDASKNVDAPRPTGSNDAANYVDTEVFEELPTPPSTNAPKVETEVIKPQPEVNRLEESAPLPDQNNPVPPIDLNKPAPPIDLNKPAPPPAPNKPAPPPAPNNHKNPPIKIDPDNPIMTEYGPSQGPPPKNPVMESYEGAKSTFSDIIDQAAWPFRQAGDGIDAFMEGIGEAAGRRYTIVGNNLDQGVLAAEARNRARTPMRNVQARPVQKELASLESQLDDVNARLGAATGFDQVLLQAMAGDYAKRIAETKQHLNDILNGAYDNFGSGSFLSGQYAGGIVGDVARRGRGVAKNWVYDPAADMAAGFKTNWAMRNDPNMGKDTLRDLLDPVASRSVDEARLRGILDADAGINTRHYWKMKELEDAKKGLDPASATYQSDLTNIEAKISQYRNDHGLGAEYDAYVDARDSLAKSVNDRLIDYVDAAQGTVRPSLRSFQFGRALEGAGGYLWDGTKYLGDHYIYQPFADFNAGWQADRIPGLHGYGTYNLTNAEKTSLAELSRAAADRAIGKSTQAQLDLLNTQHKKYADLYDKIQDIKTRLANTTDPAERLRLAQERRSIEDSIKARGNGPSFNNYTNQRELLESQVDNLAQAYRDAATNPGAAGFSAFHLGQNLHGAPRAAIAGLKSDIYALGSGLRNGFNDGYNLAGYSSGRATLDNLWNPNDRTWGQYLAYNTGAYPSWILGAAGHGLKAAPHYIGTGAYDLYHGLYNGVRDGFRIAGYGPGRATLDSFLDPQNRTWFDYLAYNAGAYPGWALGATVGRGSVAAYDALKGAYHGLYTGYHFGNPFNATDAAAYLGPNPRWYKNVPYGLGAGVGEMAGAIPRIGVEAGDFIQKHTPGVIKWPVYGALTAAGLTGLYEGARFGLEGSQINRDLWDDVYSGELPDPRPWGLQNPVGTALANIGAGLNAEGDQQLAYAQDNANAGTNTILGLTPARVILNAVTDPSDPQAKIHAKDGKTRAASKDSTVIGRGVEGVTDLVVNTKEALEDWARRPSTWDNMKTYGSMIAAALAMGIPLYFLYNAASGADEGIKETNDVGRSVDAWNALNEDSEFNPTRLGLEDDVTDEELKAMMKSLRRRRRAKQTWL